MAYKVLIESTEETVYSGPPMKFWTFYRSVTSNGSMDWQTDDIFKAAELYKQLSLIHPSSSIRIVKDIDIEVEVSAAP